MKTKLAFSLLTVAMVLLAGSGQSLAKTLECGIKHVQVMPSVKKEYRKGNILKGSAFADLDPNNSWVKIPKWMAGTWTIKSEVAVYRKNFKTGHSTSQPHKFKAHQKFQYGMQTDRNGGIWHYVGVPYKSETRLSRFDEIHVVSEKRFDSYSESRVSFRSVVNVIRTKRSSNEIHESYQQESITTYTPLNEGVGDIKLSASTKSFDQEGNPLIQADNEARVYKKEDFKEVRTYKNKDMRKLFKEFLNSTGRSNLLPF